MPNETTSFLRRRGTASSGALPRRRRSSFIPRRGTTASERSFPNQLGDAERRSNFLQEINIHPLDNEEQDDVEDDVLYPQFSPNQDGKVDMGIFQRLVHDRQRQMSESSIKLEKTLSKQNQLYSSIKGIDSVHQGVRFILYSGKGETTSLEDLLTDQGQKALESVVSSKGWWLDVLCPTYDEMRILSKTFRIHPLTTEDIQAQESREKVELFSKYTFVCFRAIEVDPHTNIIKPYSFYSLIFDDGFLTFHFKKSKHAESVRQRCNQLKEYMTITPEWMNYALIDSITDSFAPIILDVETEALAIDELTLLIRKQQQAEMLKRISQCRKQSTQLVRLLASKSDVIKSLMKRYEDRNRELFMAEQQQHPFSPIQLTSALQALSPTGVHTPSGYAIENKKAFSDVLLYLGDIQDHVVTMVQNINHYDRILHRAHTNYLAQMNLELTKTYNMTNNVMNRLTFLATVFIPLTVICSMWGMNVNVPGQHYIDYAFFFWILGGMAIYCLACVLFGKRVGIL